MKIVFRCMLFVLFSVSLFGQTKILGLRLYANDDEYQPPIIKMNEVITIEFDVNTPLPPNLNIIFRHATANWDEDKNLFINDGTKDRADQLAYAASPNGIQRYTFRYKNSFPNSRNRVQFANSGNYFFRIVDHDNSDEILEEGRFIIAEQLVSTTMEISNTYYPEGGSPLNQRHTIRVGVSVNDGNYSASEKNSLMHSFVKRVDIIQNWKLMQPYRIDLDVRNPDTFVDDFTKPNKTFSIRSIFPGNEYRRLDISSNAFYVNNQLVRLKDGADLSRFQWQGKPDANGASKLRPFTGANSEYLDVQMRLKLPNPVQDNIFLVGSFNKWQVTSQYQMLMDSSGEYQLRISVRRGVYDYQYVVGNQSSEDWYSLEGNDWRTINRYTALVYYHDDRLGGYDRVVGIIQGKSPGGSEGNKTSFPLPTKPSKYPGGVTR